MWQLVTAWDENEMRFHSTWLEHAKHVMELLICFHEREGHSSLNRGSFQHLKNALPRFPFFFNNDCIHLQWWHRTMHYFMFSLFYNHICRLFFMYICVCCPTHIINNLESCTDFVTHFVVHYCEFMLYSVHHVLIFVIEVMWNKWIWISFVSLEVQNLDLIYSLLL